MRFDHRVNLYNELTQTFRQPLPQVLHKISGESKPERTGTPFRGPVKTEDSVPGPQNVNIRTGTVVPGPQ